MTERRHHIFALHRKTLDPCFAADGQWIGRDRPPALRERLIHAVPFLHGNADQRAKGNRIIRSSQTHVCEFAPMAALQILLRYRQFLEKETVRFLKDYVASMADGFADHIHSYWGMNCNQVSMGTFTLLAGGELLGRQELVEEGMCNLWQLREEMIRNGFASEYVSSTYTPVAIAALEEIVNLVHNPEAVNLARKAADRMWFELACFWHAPSCGLGGPQSRAYTPDSMGLTRNAHSILYMAFGERIALSPLGYYEEPLSRPPYDDDPSFRRYHAVFFAIPDYHPHPAVEKLLFEKTFPYRVAGSVELAEEEVFCSRVTADNRSIRKRLSSLNWPCQQAFIRSYMTQDYAIGSSTGWWLDGGHSEQFFFTARRNQEVRSPADKVTVYARYLLNDNTIAGDNEYPFLERTSNPYCTYREGTAFTLQKDNLVIYGCQPKRFERKNISRLRLAIAIPACTSGLPDEVWYGEEQLSGFDATFDQEQTIYLRFGRSYLAIRPLVGRVINRQCAVRFGMENDFAVISLYNYEGAPRDFAETEIIEALNGFIAQAGSAADEPFASFRTNALQGRVIDQYYLWIRRIRYLEPNLYLSLEYSPNSLRYKHIAINGRHELPVRFVSNRVDETRFPWFDRELAIHDIAYGDWFERIGQRETWRLDRKQG